MSLAIGLAVYVIVWWIVLFAVLPWGVNTQEEVDSVVPGSAPSAPDHPMMLRKVIATTLISLVIFAGIYWLVTMSGATLDNIPVLSQLGGF